MKRFGKRALSVLLAVIMLMSTLSVSLVAFATVTVTNRGSTFLVVPETIYLKPSTGNSTEAQYFVNNTLSDDTVSTVAESAQGTGSLYIKIPDAKSVKIDVYDWNNAKLSYTSSQTLDNNGYAAVNIKASDFKLSTGVAAGAVNYIKWHFTVTMKDNTTQEYDTWSAVYSPYLAPVGTAIRAVHKWGTQSKTHEDSATILSGIHGYEPTGSGNYWTDTIQNYWGSSGDKNFFDGFRYAKTSSNCLVPLLGTVSAASNTASIEDWLATAASGSTVSAPTITFMKKDSHSKDNMLFVGFSPIAKLTVDTGRFSNLNQIPNLTVTSFISDFVGDKFDYYVSDDTDVSNIQIYNERSDDKSRGQTIWDRHGTYLAELSGDSNNTSLFLNKTTYSGSWNRNIDKANPNKLYVVKGATWQYKKRTTASEQMWLMSNCLLRLTLVDKSTLRNTVVNCIKAGYQSSWTNSGWSEYQSALENAYKVLGNPLATAGEISSAASTLTTKFNAVTIKSNISVTAQHMGYVRTLDELGNTIGYNVHAQLGTPVTQSNVAATNIVDIKAKSYPDYTCKGYINSASAPAVDASINEDSIIKETSRHFSSAVNAVNTTFYYKAKDITVRIDPNGGVWNNNTGVSSITASYGSSFAPATPTRTGYTFDCWSITAGGADSIVDDEEHTITFGAADVTISAKWKANSYTVSFDVNKPAQGTAPATPAAQTATYDAAIGTLPVVAMDAYEFAGWYTAAQGGSKIEATTTYNWIADNTTLFAHWETHGYQITFDANGGDSIPFMDYDTENGVLPVATREGYTFVNWTVTAAEGNWTVGDTVAEAASLLGKYGNVTLRANWTANDYEVTFDLNDADRVGNAVLVNKTMTATYDTLLGTLPTPTLTGYSFDGWYTEAEGGIQVTADTLYKTAGAATYYAHWTPITYTATLLPRGGTIDGMGDDERKTISYTIESTFTFPDVVRDGYTFEDWSPTSKQGNWDAAATYDIGQQPAAHMYGNVIIEAEWIDNEYALIFNLNDSDKIVKAECETARKFVHFDGQIGELPVPTMTAYEFKGWYDAPVEGNEYTAEMDYHVPGNTTLYAHWSPIKYTITYDTGFGGDPLESREYTIEDTLVLPVASREGYNFTQWMIFSTTQDDKDGTSWVQGTYIAVDALNLGTGNYGDVTLRAMFEMKKFKITWVVNGATTVVDVEYGAMPSHAIPVITNDPCYEYEFTGWDKPIVAATADATYEARFIKTPKAYTLNWRDEDGTVLHSEEVAYGSAITVWTLPEKEGYTAQWDNIPATMPASDSDIFVKYTPKQYTITWVDENGNILKTDSNVDYDSTPVYNGTEPTKAQDSKYVYLFDGWTPEISAVKDDTTYTAVYKKIPKTYTITWILTNTDGTTSTFTTTADYGEEITNIPSIPKIHGYAGEWKDVPETMVDRDLTIRGEYISGARTVTWVLDSDTGRSVETVVFDGNKPVYNLTKPQKAKTAEYTYTFKGWAATANGDVLSDFPVVDGNDVTYYAVYDRTPNTYTVTWVADGTVIKTETVAYGTTIPTVAVPDKTGYNGAWDFTAAQMPAKNLTITAVYTPKKFIITWIVGDKIIDTEWAYDSVPVFDGVPTKESTATEDFTFSGWSPEVTKVTGRATYTAQFTSAPRKYLVTFMADGNVLGTQTVAYGDAIGDIPAVPDKVGYTGAWENIPATMPANDVVINVKYTPRQYTITWVTPDGVVTTKADYDSIPSFDGADPVKPSTAERDYTFIGWAPAIKPVSRNAVYTAQFEESARKYTATFIVNGIVLETREIAYGDVIGKPDVPERDGYIGEWETTYRTMPASDIVINAVYTPRNYTVTWRVDGLTVYTTTIPYGQLIPEREVPEKPGYTGTWDYDYIGMPSHSLVINAVYTVNSYTIRWNVGGDSNEDTVVYGQNYEYYFNCSEFPAAIRVTVKGKMITDFEYNKTTGRLFIPGNVIIGDVYVTERAAEGYNNIYIKIDNGGSSNNAEVIKDGMAYHTQIYAPDGYLLPESVEVYLDGILVTRGYTYNEDTGKLTINAEIMTGELEIKATCPVDPNYVPPSEKPDDSDDTKHGGLFGWLYDLFDSLMRFFKRIFGTAA